MWVNNSHLFQLSRRVYGWALHAAARLYFAVNGLLGPAARRDRLLSELGESAQSLAARLRGPAGIDIGGRGPAAIALSIIAEVQGVLQGRIG